MALFTALYILCLFGGSPIANGTRFLSASVFNALPIQYLRQIVNRVQSSAIWLRPKGNELKFGLGFAEVILIP